ncbi:uncharacterized protein LOC129588665 [Paramacrobiotus metropolitanus]|uniref:uncharacterized protein LOC129588665 n=1 Tax=Paramacrobiotus metropolitanus TaxID=2943436 RepID=UPI002445FD5C|nr:uncharacterized protein LOC129588665 [Paramacrobiotus metropolitanus]
MATNQKTPFDKMSVAKLEHTLAGTKKLLADRRILEGLPDDGFQLRKNVAAIESLLNKHRMENSSAKAKSSKSLLDSSRMDASGGMETLSAKSLRQTAAHFRVLASPKEKSLVPGENDLNDVDSVTEAFSRLHPDFSQSVTEDHARENNQAPKSLPIPHASSSIHGNSLARPKVSLVPCDDGSDITVVKNPADNAQKDDSRDIVTSRAKPASFRSTPKNLKGSTVGEGQPKTPSTAAKSKIALLSMEEVMVLVERDRKAQQELLARVQAANPHLRHGAESERLMQSRAVQFLQYRDQEDDKLSDDEQEEMDNESDDILTDEEEEE